MILDELYYACKPYLPWSLRIFLRRARAHARSLTYANVWPIDPGAGASPRSWPGWPGRKQFALVLTHDVDTERGLARIDRLASLESDYNLRSSFNLVPEGEYRVPVSARRKLVEAGFEVAVHGLEHDGKLYASRTRFSRKAARINDYLEEWNACGFRSPLMQHRLSWLHELNVLYDSSTFDTDPFEPEPDGVGTIFPFWVPGADGSGYVELPYTLPQDFTLFVIFRQRGADTWKRKLDWIAERGGMALVNTHPDYMAFHGSPGRGEYPVSYYQDFLTYVRRQYDGAFWPARACDVASFYTGAVPVGSRNTWSEEGILCPA